MPAADSSSSNEQEQNRPNESFERFGNHNARHVHEILLRRFVETGAMQRLAAADSRSTLAINSANTLLAETIRLRDELMRDLEAAQAEDDASSNSEDYSGNEEEDETANRSSKQMFAPPFVEHPPGVTLRRERLISQALLTQSCAICQDDFRYGQSVVKFSCAHFFCETCVVPWLAICGSCPTCRHVIGPMDFTEVRKLDAARPEADACATTVFNTMVECSPARTQNGDIDEIIVPRAVLTHNTTNAASARRDMLSRAAYGPTAALNTSNSRPASAGMTYAKPPLQQAAAKSWGSAIPATIPLPVMRVSLSNTHFAYKSVIVPVIHTTPTAALIPTHAATSSGGSIASDSMKANVTQIKERISLLVGSEIKRPTTASSALRKLSELQTVTSAPSQSAPMNIMISGSISRALLNQKTPTLQAVGGGIRRPASAAPCVSISAAEAALSKTLMSQVVATALPCDANRAAVLAAVMHNVEQRIKSKDEHAGTDVKQQQSQLDQAQPRAAPRRVTSASRFRHLPQPLANACNSANAVSSPQRQSTIVLHSTAPLGVVGSGQQWVRTKNSLRVEFIRR